jgi:LysR family transcriptional regulator, nitrogen assimilation regulatory protein
MPERHSCDFMDIRRLKTFVTVADHGTVSRAASLLNTTQPALSRQISSLEQELGFKLFGRVGRRLVLTTRGQQMVADCRNVLNRVGALAEQARALRQGEIKLMRIVASSLTIEGLFPSLLNSKCECGPGIKVKPVEAHARDHLGMLERGEADLSINVVNDLRVDDDLFGTHLLPQFHVVAACARTYDIERTEAIDIRKVARHPLLLLTKDIATRAIFDSACRLANARPNVLIESTAAHGLLALAETGQGVAIVPSILRTERWSVRTMRVTHRRQPLRISLALIWDRRRMAASHAEHCGEILADHVRKMFPHGSPVRCSNGARSPH